MYSKFYSFLRKYNNIHSSQNGFVKGKGLETTVFSFLYEINRIIDKKEIGIALYIDLSKAFDTLNHDILLKKLNLYGIGGGPITVV